MSSPREAIFASAGFFYNRKKEKCTKKPGCLAGAVEGQSKGGWTKMGWHKQREEISLYINSFTNWTAVGNNLSGEVLFVHWGCHWAQQALGAEHPPSLCQHRSLSGPTTQRPSWPCWRLFTQTSQGPLSPEIWGTTSRQRNSHRPSSERASWVRSHSLPMRRDQQLLWCPVWPLV